jgi:hypothetical protein
LADVGDPNHLANVSHSNHRIHPPILSSTSLTIIDGNAIARFRNARHHWTQAACLRLASQTRPAPIIVASLDATPTRLIDLIHPTLTGHFLRTDRTTDRPITFSLAALPASCRRASLLCRPDQLFSRQRSGPRGDTLSAPDAPRSCRSHGVSWAWNDHRYRKTKRDFLSRVRHPRRHSDQPVRQEQHHLARRYKKGRHMRWTYLYAESTWKVIGKQVAPFGCRAGIQYRDRFPKAQRLLLYHPHSSSS